MPEQTIDPQIIGVVTGIQGEAFAESGAGVRALVSGSPVYKGEELVTAAGGNVEVRFIDDTLLSQGADSRVALDDYFYDDSAGVGDFLVDITQGTFRLVTGKIAEQNPERFKVGTPLATIGIRGTIILSEVGPDGEKHGVEEIHAGKAMLLQSKATGQMRQLFSGQMVDVSTSGLLSSVRPLSPRELQDFRKIAPQNIRQEQDIREQQDDEQQNDDQTEEQNIEEQAGEQSGEQAGENPQQGELSGDVNPGGGDVLGPDGVFAGGIIEGGGNSIEQPVEPKADKDAGNVGRDLGREITPEPIPVGHQNGGSGNKNGEITALIEGPDNNDTGTTASGTTSDPHNITGSGLITGTSEADTITGSSSNDIIRGLAGNDTLHGLGGNDELNGGLGDDYIDGGAGIDFVNYVDATGSVSVCLTDETSSGADGHDSLSSIEGVFGSASGDSIYGNNGSNTLYGKDGVDTVSGYGGSDTIVGGRGNDVLDGGTGAASNVDFASYAEATDSVSVSLTSGSSSGADGEDTLSNFEGIIGSAHVDTLDGDNSANTLLGNDGNDTLIGREGDDHLDGGEGIDSVSYAGAGASVSVSLLDGTSTGAHGADTLSNVEGINGSPYGDTLTGDNTANTLCGNGGDDNLYGNGGSDTVSYVDASASVTVNLATNTATGADGNDTLSSIENVTGSSHADTITGDTGNNIFYDSDRSADVYDGGDGIDTVDYSGMTGFINALFDQNKVTVEYDMPPDNDTITGIEVVIGTQYDDGFQVGDRSATMHAGEGLDRMHCTSVSSGITINNSTGTATSGAFTFGFSSIEDFYASGLVDTFIGATSGSETIDCGHGSDTFTLYDNAETTIKYGSLYANADTITNFNSGEDKFLFTSPMDFDNTAGFKADGTVSGSHLAYFVYESNKLYYDADGDANGSGGQVLIADISGDAVQQSDITFSW
ncbi:FecR domain-containing protein [Maridesulfovibrio sp.]|uniref:FecR domain-containing protein n=1 Tax=Maridesulfovibrio sp. TaxID=2795000 RepID=UPI003BAD549C